MLLALCATAIVIVALMWEVCLPRIEEELDKRARGGPTSRASASTRGASAAPSNGRASCSSRA